MDFSLSETQQAVRDLAAQIFAGHATVDRLKEVELGEERVDRLLWVELARAHLLGLSLPERDGGSGFGMVELCLVLEQQGRHVAPVPLLPTVVAGMAVAECGNAEQRQALLPGLMAGDLVLAIALANVGTVALPPVSAVPGAGGWVLTGGAPTVPAGHIARRVVVPARTPDGGVAVLLVDPDGPGVTKETVTTTNRERAAHLTFHDAPVALAEQLGTTAQGGRIVEWITQRALTGLAALQAGVTAQAVRLAAAHTSARHQFGRPLSTFQGVALRAADAYIDTQAIDVTLWQAAWRLDAGRDAAREVLIAKWWASEAGQRVVHASQHLHGGLGADVDYPVHRYFLWGKQIEDMLGGASASLAGLGRVVAARATAGAAAE